MIKQHFVYMWYDKSRKMFYIGKHSGRLNDNYISSSKWLNGEVRYRPTEFKRRIIKICKSENESQKLEGYLLSLINESEWLTKYYNNKQGRPKGIPAANKGMSMSDEQKIKISKSRKGQPCNNRVNPHASESGKKGAIKLSQMATGRRRVIRNGQPTWAYPTDTDYPTS